MWTTEELPAFIFADQDDETGEKRWFSIKGMGVEYVRATDAVTALSVLQDEIKSLRSELANARNAALILREALEQFIWGDETIETILFGEFKDDRRMTFTIPIGALRRARAALKAEGESRE